MGKLTHVPVPDERIERPTSPDVGRERRLAVLEKYLSDHRQQRLEHALRNRIGAVAMMVDGIYDLGNASAIMRTCEGLGVHRVYFVELEEQYKAAHRTSQGAHKWLSIQRFVDPVKCVRTAQRDGYKVYGAALGGSTSLEEIDLSTPVALAMGSESEGLSQELMDACDGLYEINMRGLSQSFNVSVAAAISMHHVLGRRRRELGISGRHGDLSDDALDALREEWYRKAIKNADLMLERELGEVPPKLAMLEGPLASLE